MNYDAYTYLFPPRPEVKVPRGMLTYYEKLGWWAQKKKNGTNTPVFTNGTQVIFKTRHLDEDHKMWSPKPEHIDYFRQLAKNGKWHMFCCELLHNKTQHIKDHLYIFDIIVKDGVQLVGTSLAQRQNTLMEGVVGDDMDDRIEVSPYISVAKCYKTGFVELFDHLAKEDEGLVIKDPNAKLKPCFREGGNGLWQVKSRIPTPNYSY